MTFKQALALGKEKLAGLQDVDNSSLESEILLRNVLQINRAQLYFDLDQDLPPEKAQLFSEWIKRRLEGEPIAYIIGCREFFGLDFFVDKRVLIPRPETELIVETAIRFSQTHPVKTIADIGTGSGVIAVSLAVNLARLEKIYATDLSRGALEVAVLNASRHGVENRITFLEGNLLVPLPERVDILIANLPYVTSEEIAQMPSAKYEPRLALDGGERGLSEILRMANQIRGKVNPGACVLIEIGQGQSRDVSKHLHLLFPEAVIETLFDLAGIDRVVSVSYPLHSAR